MQHHQSSVTPAALRDEWDSVGNNSAMNLSLESQMPTIGATPVGGARRGGSDDDNNDDDDDSEEDGEDQENAIATSPASSYSFSGLSTKYGTGGLKALGAGGTGAGASGSRVAGGGLASTLLGKKGPLGSSRLASSQLSRPAGERKANFKIGMSFADEEVQEETHGRKEKESEEEQED
jgi:hypothetical protein